MTIHVAGWILWALGSIVGMVVLGLAVFGVFAMVAFREQQRSLGRWFGW